ncbi:MAG: TRAP transporter substrate-binding protein [Sedimentisphaerales bacterium]|nr:TRAP transporter substrate-binding protein [Sedimentisphaerales bacterium]
MGIGDRTRRLGKRRRPIGFGRETPGAPRSHPPAEELAMKIRWIVILLALAIPIVGPGGCKEKGDAKTLKMGHSLPEDHPVHTAMEYMAALVYYRSHGAIRIEIYPNEQLGSEREMIEQVQGGILDLCKTSTSPLESFIPEMAVYSVPYIFRDRDHYWKVLRGPVGEELKKACEAKDIVGLCYYDSGSRSFYTKDKPIMKPEDLAGMKIRVMQSKTSMDMVETIGASPTPIAWGELYTALQQGVVDGAENNPPSLYTSRHYEVCKHYSLDEHTMIPDIVLMSKNTWDEKLTPEEQELIQETVNDSMEFQILLWEQYTRMSMNEVQKAGVIVYRPDKTAFREKVKGMHQAYFESSDPLQKKIGELIKRIQDVE